MPRNTYGPQTRGRVKRLLEALLDFVNDALSECHHVDLRFSWQNEDGSHPRLLIRTRLRALQELTQQDRYERSLTKPQVRESLHLMENFLGVLEDHRVQKRGSEDWYFTLRLWARDTEENLRQFESEWERRRSEKSKQLELTVRGNKPSVDICISHLPVTSSNLFGREQELKILDEAWSKPEVNVISLVAWGGVGKSALVNKWLRNMSRNDYCGAEKVYAWSFYSQGTSDQMASADLFIESALLWFGDPNPRQGSAWERGCRLASLVRVHRTLLILDGLEPLQFPPGSQEGRLKDQSLQALLRELAVLNAGLCVISTRLSVTDLNDHDAPEVQSISLSNLSSQDGAQLLYAMGVIGDQREIEDAVEEFSGHCLALTLLGNFLAHVYDGNIGSRREVVALQEEEQFGGHARRVMTSYEKWLGERSAEFSVLRLLGLFDRPADLRSLSALRAKPPIPNLTEPLEGVSEPKWRQILSKLRRTGLLAARDPYEPDALDAHPLVREHFGHRLREGSPEAWQAGHTRLYKYLKGAAKELPDNLQDMSLLYVAVAHGCKAGCYQETFSEIYWRRILRGYEYFSTYMIAAFGMEVAALSHFFVVPWSQPAGELTEFERGRLLSQVGYCLRALGRLLEAIEPMKLGMEYLISLENWFDAADSAGNLSRIYLPFGAVNDALVYAQRGVELADNSQVVYQRVDKRTILGDALHQAGQFEDARMIFKEAETIQRNDNQELPFLYSFAGIRYCDLLLSLGNYEEVKFRAENAIRLVQQSSQILLDFSLNKVCLAQAVLLRQESNDDNIECAEPHFNEAVEGLRKAGRQDYLPHGLLERAKLYCVKGDFRLAERDINEAFSISIRGDMGLNLCNAHIGYTQMRFMQNDRESAKRSLIKAKELARKMGYCRRDKEIREIEDGLYDRGCI